MTNRWCALACVRCWNVILTSRWLVKRIMDRKDIAPDELRRAVHVVAGGEALLSPAITHRVMQQLAAQTSSRTNPALLAELTEREVEVLRHIGLGESNEEIAHNLVISPATARTYVSRLLDKLQARDRAQLVVIAYESGLVTPGQTP